MCIRDRGNGAAGFNAAKAIRERDKTGTVILISDEQYPSYNRPMLTKSIVAGLSAEQIAIEEPDWYKENNIYQMLSRQVECVDMKEKEVCLDDGSKVHFTKLIYALGSECFVPPIEGNNLPEVVAIRRLRDVEKVCLLYTSILYFNRRGRGEGDCKAGVRRVRSSDEGSRIFKYSLAI